MDINKLSERLNRPVATVELLLEHVLDELDKCWADWDEIPRPAPQEVADNLAALYLAGLRHRHPHNKFELVKASVNPDDDGVLDVEIKVQVTGEMHVQTIDIDFWEVSQ